MQTEHDRNQGTLPLKIFEILAKEVELSGRMLKILNQEKTALVEMDMQTLLCLSRNKEELLARIQTLDQALLQAVGQLTGSPGKTAAKLTELSSLATEEEKKQLAVYREKLIEMREQIVSRNSINKHFAEDTQHFLNDAISLITNTAAERPMYGGKGTNKPSVRQPSLISREV